MVRVVVAHDAESLFLSSCTIHVSVVSRVRHRSEFCPEHVVLNTSESSQDRLCRSGAKCDKHRELLDQ